MSMEQRIENIETRLDGVETLLRETRDGVIKIATRIEGPQMLQCPINSEKLKNHEERIANTEKDVASLNRVKWIAITLLLLAQFALTVFGARFSEFLFPSKPQAPVAAVVHTNAFTAYSDGFKYPH